MEGRSRDRRSTAKGKARSAAPPATVAGNPVLALQGAVGNRATGRVLSRRKAPAGQGTFENSVTIDGLGPIEVTSSNIASWTSKKLDADDLELTTKAGKHSAALKELADGRKRADKLEVQAITGENAWVIVTFKRAVLTGYERAADGKTESWKAIRFDAVDIKRTSIGKPRP